MIRKYLAIVRHPHTYRQGRSEAFLSTGLTFAHPESLRSVAYDMGRNHAERT